MLWLLCSQGHGSGAQKFWFKDRPSPFIKGPVKGLPRGTAQQLRAAPDAEFASPFLAPLRSATMSHSPPAPPQAWRILGP